MELDSTQYDRTGFDAEEAAAFRPALASDRFEQFEQHLEEALAEMVNRWRHMAAPIAEKQWALSVALCERRKANGGTP